MIFWLLKAWHWIRMAYQTVTNHWMPEIKRLNDELKKQEDSLAGTDDCVVDIFNLEEKLEDKMTYLEEDLASAKTDIGALKDHLNSIVKERIENKLKSLEEELTAVKAQNAELRNHLNSTIKELNNIAGFVNQQYDDLIEQTYEIDSP